MTAFMTTTTTSQQFLSIPDNRDSEQLRQQLRRSSGLVPERHEEFRRVNIVYRVIPLS